MKRLLLCVCLCATLGVLACSSPEGNNNNTNTNNNSTAECQGPRDCWKKVCPQDDKVEYQECVTKRVNTQIPPDGGENHKPEYLSCSAEQKCVDIATDTLGGGKINVSLEPSDVRIQWLRLSIYPTKDMDNKDITCERLKKMAVDDPESLMSEDLRRFWPPRDANQPITTQVFTQQGRSLPMLFGVNPVTVPAGKHIYVIQGFCNPPEGGTPVSETPHKWWACKEGAEFKAGLDSTEIEAKLDTSQNPACPPG